MQWFSNSRWCLKLQLGNIYCGLRHSSWSSQAVRSTFIKYFQGQGHEYVPSSSVIPRKGEGTYFTNAGMNQFKPLFLGELDPTSKFHTLTRAVNSQKCIRVGGKHNDLDDVGHDLTHHTFFEMLGNWSFGDYFKAEACAMAYELLSKEFGLSTDRLYFTYFAGDQDLNLPVDEECRQIWLSLGIPEERVLPFGAKDNFWDMGLTGPCGPCTEIHYDHIGGRYAGSQVNSGSPSVVEIWNLVFMQYNRQGDQSLKPLPTFHVDTGMGLERMTAVLNGSADNYTTDLFLPLFQAIEKESKCLPYRGNQSDLNTSYRMLADHVRMFTVAIGDGLLPRQDNLGHKLRTILHRCIHLCREVFYVKAEIMLPSLISLVIQSLGAVYPELPQNEQKICEVVQATIEHHDRNREQAIKSFNKMLSKSMKSQQLSGEVILALEKGFYGSPLPLEMIKEQASIYGLSLDMAAYQKLVQERQAQVSTAPLTIAANVASSLVNGMISQHSPATQDDFKYDYHPCGDSGYDFTSMAHATQPCHIQGLSCQGQVVDKLGQGDQGELVLDRTCFYAESGGQEADIGQLVTETGEFMVTDVQHLRGYVVHYGQVTKGTLQFGQSVEPRIAQATRQGCMRNHTATHLLNAALIEVLPNTQQEGSIVTPYKFTFDFLALTPLENSDIEKVENTVRDLIKQERPISRRVIPFEDALKLREVKLLQNEDYPAEVSVITIGSEDGNFVVSQELCGGTHVWDTSHLAEFCITNLTSKAQSVRRATCVTGQEAELAHLNGKIMQSMCVVLQSLVESREITETDIDKLTTLIQQTLTYLEGRQERLEHSLETQGTWGGKERTRLQEQVEENVKTRAWCQDFNDCLTQLQDPGIVENVMKQLISQIRKGSLLEYLPKTVRDQAQSSLEKLEHKVSEAVNKKGALLLQKLIEDQVSAAPVSGYHILQIGHIDMGQRQMIKALSQQSWDHFLVLTQASNKSTNILVNLPLSAAKAFTKEEFNNVISQLDAVGKTKGKMASENDKVVIYTFTVQGNVDSAQVLEILNRQKIIDR